MTLTNFFLLHAPHNGWMLPMSFEPPLVKGTAWSACNTASVSPQARHLFPYLSQSALNSSAVKLPGLACFAALLLRPLLAWACLTFSGFSSPHFLLRTIISSR